MYKRVENIIEKIDLKVYEFFNLSEILASRSLTFLYFICFGISFKFLNDSYYYLSEKVVNVNCWQFFPNCQTIQDILFFNNNLGLRPIYFAFLLFTFFVSVFSFFRQRYGLSHLFFIAFIFLNFVPIFLFTNNYNLFIHHQDHYFFYTILIMLFVTRNRMQFLTLFFALTYLYSSVPKVLSPDWILGTWEIPYVSREFFPFLSNALVLLQIVIPFFMLFGNKYTRIISVLIFESFHFYTTTIWNVKFTFIFQIIPFLYVLYIADFKRPHLQDLRKSTVGLLLLFLFTFLSLFRLVIPGDDYVTTEGSGLSLNMFFQRTRCAYYYADRNMESRIEENLTSSVPCEIHKILQDLHRECVDEKPRFLKIDQYTALSKVEIVNQENYCKLTYNPIWHNSWIKADIDKYAILDYNSMNWSQKLIYPYRYFLANFYLFAFWLVFSMIVFKLCKHPNQDKRGD